MAQRTSCRIKKILISYH